MREPCSPTPRTLSDAMSHLAMALLVLDLRREDLLRHRCDAMDLRWDSRALRAEARQARRRARQRPL